MLERVDHDNGLVTLRSSLLAGAGVRHGFSTRVGGLSQGSFASLNLGSLAKNTQSGLGDANTLISENYRRLRAALGMERMPRFAARQCHGAGVWRVEHLKPPREADVPEADALVTAVGPVDRGGQSVGGPMLTIRTADCVPVLLATRDGRAVGAAHAGWRGIVAGVVGQTVAALCEVAEVGAGEVVAAIGPGIGLEPFEVGVEVAEEFTQAGLGAAVHSGRAGWGERPHVDLAGAVRARLNEAGVGDDAIDAAETGELGACTYEQADWFFSYRRDVTHGGAARTGHMAAVIGTRG